MSRRVWGIYFVTLVFVWLSISIIAGPYAGFIATATFPLGAAFGILAERDETRRRQ